MYTYSVYHITEFCPSFSSPAFSGPAIYPLWPHHPQFAKWKSSPFSRISNPKASLGLEVTKRKTHPAITAWLRAIEADLKPLNIGLSSAWKKATSRETWRSVVDTATLKKSTPWEEKEDLFSHIPVLHFNVILTHMHVTVHKLQCHVFAHSLLATDFKATIPSHLAPGHNLLTASLSISRRMHLRTRRSSCSVINTEPASKQHDALRLLYVFNCQRYFRQSYISELHDILRHIAV